MDNLPELRDIHLPSGVSIFPPAYGWWVILVTLFALILIYKFILLLRKKSKKRYAIRLLSNINRNNIVVAAIEISEILRRICIYKYPSANAIFGKDWIAFLNNHSKNILPKNSAELLTNAPYAPNNTDKYSKDDLNSLIKFAEEWIGENL